MIIFLPLQHMVARAVLLVDVALPMRVAEGDCIL